jgi:integrase
VNPESLRFFAKSPRVRQDPAYNVLTEEELSRMLNAARASNYRDYVMLAVMAGCGLREVEVVGLRIGDFREVAEHQVLLRVLGKGDKVRNVSISPRLPQSPVHLQGRQGQAPYHPLGPEHSEEVRACGGHNKGYLTPLHPPHRGHQYGTKRGTTARHSTVPRPL